MAAIDGGILIPLPLVHQRLRFDCGAAVLQAVCRYYGVGPEDEDQFLGLCRTDSVNGTDPEDLVVAAHRVGLAAESREGITIAELKRTLEAGRPVICAIQAWGEERAYGEHEWGHYVVAIGYDDRRILFQDPGRSARCGAIWSTRNSSAAGTASGGTSGCSADTGSRSGASARRRPFPEFALR